MTKPIYGPNGRKNPAKAPALDVATNGETVDNSTKPKPSRDDLLLLLAERDSQVKKAEEEIDRIKASFAVLLEPYAGMVVRHKVRPLDTNGNPVKGEALEAWKKLPPELYRVVKGRGGWGLRALESEAVKAARRELEAAERELDGASAEA